MDRNTGVSRRGMLGVAATGAILRGSRVDAMRRRQAATGMPQEGATTPHLCLGPIADRELTPDGIRRYTQLGLSHIILNGGGFPWEADALRAKVRVLRENGLTVGDIGLPWSGSAGAAMREIVGAGPGRNQAIEEICRSIRAAAAAGIPLVEYNFYAHRLEEGYAEVPDPARGDAMVESFDYARVRDLRPLLGEAARTLDELWANCAYFLKRVVPVAEDAGVVLALHPNDPPAPLSRGSRQIMATLDGWKKFVRLHDSPANTIIFDCGVTRELGEDPVKVAHWFASRKRIGLVHYRNVRLRKAYLYYTEVYPDNGDIDMLAVMQALVDYRYTSMIFPEHARGLDFDRVLQTGNYAAAVFHIGYTRAMLQVALMSRGRYAGAGRVRE